MKRIFIALTLLAVCTFIQAGENEPDDWSYWQGSYAVNVSFPYESAVLTGPEFREGTAILKTYVEGALESDESFQVRLKRIVDALAVSEPEIAAAKALTTKKKRK